MMSLIQRKKLLSLLKREMDKIKDAEADSSHNYNFFF